MPRFRAEITALNPYEVGRPIEDVAREFDLDPDSIIKLTANESPEGPFPGVIDAVSAVLGNANRYPDNDLWDLSQALAHELAVPRESLLFGSGSTALISAIASAAGGPGTNLVYGWPSFVMYRFAALWSGSGFVEVPLDGNYELDLNAIGNAINVDTRVVVLCNPNNPTGTIKSADEIEHFIDMVADDVLVVVDEAYHEYVGDPRYGTAIGLALGRRNVIVLRTFSKIYSLAGFRVGFAIGHAETLAEVRKAQAPLTVATASQAAALASLGQPDEVSRRVEANAAARHYLSGVLAERDMTQIASQTNFIFFKMPGHHSDHFSTRFTELGVILRPMSDGWLRVTVGSPGENQKFVEALDVVLDRVR